MERDLEWDLCPSGAKGDHAQEECESKVLSLTRNPPRKVKVCGGSARKEKG